MHTWHTTSPSLFQRMWPRPKPCVTFPNLLCVGQGVTGYCFPIFWRHCVLVKNRQTLTLWVTEHHILTPELWHCTGDICYGVGTSVLLQSSGYFEHLAISVVFEVESGQHIRMACLPLSLLLHLLVRAVIFHRNIKCGPVLQECFSGFVGVHSHNGG